MMMVSDLASGVATIVVLVLYCLATWKVWHLYITSAISGTFQAFQWPSFLCCDHHHAAQGAIRPCQRHDVAGRIRLRQSSPRCCWRSARGDRPWEASWRSTSLLLSRCRRAVFGERASTGDHAVGRESQAASARIDIGFTYILRRQPAGATDCVHGGKFPVTIAFTLLAPMILSRTDYNELIYGTISSAGAIGAWREGW